MKYAIPYLTAACLILSLLSCGEEAPTESALARPNFVVIVTDDLGWTDLSSYGNDFIETPNLDRLAARGMRFTDAYAAAPLCSASRASLMTGKHPVAVNIIEHIHGNQPARPDELLQTPFIDQQLALEEVTFAERLRAIGYRTGFIGKWHLGGGEFSPQYQGFDLNIAGGYDGLPLTFFYPYFREGSKPELQIPENEDRYLTDVLTDHAISFVDSVSHPFLLYLAYYSPHVPIEGKAADVEYYRAKRGPDAGDTTIMPNIHYAAMVQAIDANVGRLLGELDARGLTDSTVIIFTSDNGGLHVPSIPGFDKHTPPMSNAPLREGKGFTYEGGNRVPLIAYYPGGEAGVSEVPVVGSDLFATLLSAAGNTSELGSGNSWLPLLRGGASFPTERDIVWHNPHYNHQGHKPSSAIRRGDWKLIHFYEDGRDELYNLSDDPSETNNLTASNPQRVEALRGALMLELEGMGARFPEPNPGYREG